MTLCVLGAWAQTPKSGFFTTSDNVRLHYLEAGSGPAIVFIPGWTMPVWIWEKQIAHFAPKYHVIAVDPRSQGESDKPVEGNYPERRARDYKEMVDHLKLNSPVLVGWSMGVPEILAYADQFGGSDVRAVVLVDGFVVVDDAMQKFFLQLGRSVAMERKQVVRQFIPGMYKKPQAEAYFQRLIAESLKTPTNSAVELLILSHRDWTSVLPKLAGTPVLFTATKALAKQTEVVRTAIPKLQAEIFEDAGHALFVDDADRFNATLQQFLDGLHAK